jgi:exopolysaccharide production protein ExoZ
MKLNSIQMLRAVAAFLVVYTHSIGQMGIFADSWQQHTPARTSLGAFGVDLFFVISGFIIYRSAAGLNGRTASQTFLWHRFRRVNPAYYAATLLTVLTWLPSLIRHQRPPLTGLQLLSWAIPLPFPGDPGRAIVQVWTLYFEWLFYLIFFLLIFFRVQIKALWLCLILCTLALLGWVLQDDLNGAMIFYLDPLLLEFGMGVGIGVAFKRWNPGKRTALFCLLWPGMILGILLMGTGYADFAIMARPTFAVKILHALYWGSAATLIVAGCTFLEKNGSLPRLFNNRLIGRLGDASYSIYLIHLLAFGAIAAFYLRVGFFLNPDLAIPIHAAIAVAISLVFYKWVERPILHYLKR